MKSKNASRLLGAAFLLQATAPIIGNMFLLDSLMVDDSLMESMTNVANNILQANAGILMEMFTAVGIITIGVLMYSFLRKQDKQIATLGMVLYLVEAAVLVASKIPLYGFLLVSQESLMAGQTLQLLVLAETLYGMQEYGYAMTMLPFALGGTLFYYLFYRSGIIPKALIILGLIAAPLALIGTVFSLLGYSVPIYVFILNLPFELGMGFWFLLRGIKTEPDGSSTLGQ